MKKLVDLVFESIPGVTVVLSGLLPNKKTSADECAKLMDEKYLEQMKLYPEGKKWLYRRWVCTDNNIWYWNDADAHVAYWMDQCG